MLKILLAVDGSESCDKATKKVFELSQEAEVEISVITVIEEMPSVQLDSSPQIRKEFGKMEEIEEEAKNVVGSCAEALKDYGKVDTIVAKGRPEIKICEEAQSDDYDIVVVADRGKGAVKKFFLGSTTEKVVRHCDKTVMVVK